MQINPLMNISVAKRHSSFNNGTLNSINNANLINFKRNKKDVFEQDEISEEQQILSDEIKRRADKIYPIVLEKVKNANDYAASMFYVLGVNSDEFAADTSDSDKLIHFPPSLFNPNEFKFEGHDYLCHFAKGHSQAVLYEMDGNKMKHIIRYKYSESDLKRGIVKLQYETNFDYNTFLKPITREKYRITLDQDVRLSYVPQSDCSYRRYDVFYDPNVDNALYIESYTSKGKMSPYKSKEEYIYNQNGLLDKIILDKRANKLVSNNLVFNYDNDGKLNKVEAN